MSYLNKMPKDVVQHLTNFLNPSIQCIFKDTKSQIDPVKMKFYITTGDHYTKFVTYIRSYADKRQYLLMQESFQDMQKEDGDAFILENIYFVKTKEKIYIMMDGVTTCLNRTPSIDSQFDHVMNDILQIIQDMIDIRSNYKFVEKLYYDESTKHMLVNNNATYILYNKK